MILCSFFYRMISPQICSSSANSVYTLFQMRVKRYFLATHTCKIFISPSVDRFFRVPRVFNQRLVGHFKQWFLIQNCSFGKLIPFCIFFWLREHRESKIKETSDFHDDHLLFTCLLGSADCRFVFSLSRE